jgi:glycosyltransferase involved in cell wall biosynthesis
MRAGRISFARVPRTLVRCRTLPPRHDVTHPRFTIVIPTFNRARALTQCLAAVCDLAVPAGGLEVIVVNDGGERVDVAPFEQRIALRLCAQQHAGPATARNRGANLAQGEYVAFTDDDCRPEAGWLLAFERALERNPDHGLGGDTVNALGSNVYSEASQELIAYLYRYYNGEPGKARLLTSNNLCLPRDRFLEVGGFPENFALPAGEDRALCDRWLHLGHRLTRVPDAIVNHAHRLCLASFVRQHFGYGRGAYLFHQERRKYTREPVVVEPMKFYRDLVLHARKANLDRAGRLMALMALSQVLTVAGFIREAARPQGRHVS